MEDENYKLAKEEWDLIDEQNNLNELSKSFLNQNLNFKSVKTMLLNHAREIAGRVDCTAVKSADAVFCRRDQTFEQNLTP